MIYSAWGCKLEIIGYCGKHGRPPMMLVRAKRGSGEIRHYFVYTLRADGGSKEIDATVDAAPEIKMDRQAILLALYEAE
jgi:hypothetical protein